MTEQSRLSRSRHTGWIMWTTGDGNFQRLCQTEADVQRFICEAIFGEVHTSDDEAWGEVEAHFACFTNPDNWGGDRWDLRFEDGGVHALRLTIALSENARWNDALDRALLAVEGEQAKYSSNGFEAKAVRGALEYAMTAIRALKEPINVQR